MTTFFFFSSRRRHTRYWRDWSSDVCSSDLKDDIERMMRDAEAHAEEDKRRREEAETRNLAESLQYQTEKFLAENGDKIPADKKEELGEALTELRSDRKSTRLNSSHANISYAVFCLKKKKYTTAQQLLY